MPSLGFEIKCVIARRIGRKHVKTISDWVANCVPLKATILLFVIIK